MMLPDHLTTSTEDYPPQDLKKIPDFLEITYLLEEQLKEDIKSIKDNSIITAERVSDEDANYALSDVACRGNPEQVTILLSLVEKNKIPVFPKTLSNIVRYLSAYGHQSSATQLFNRIIAYGTDPNEDAWAAVIEAKAYCNDLDGALALLKRLKHMKIELPTSVYNQILKTYLDRKDADGAFAFWIKMHTDGVTFDVISFTTIIEQCIQTNQVERAFFYLDEARVIGVALNADFFAALINCCADAPVWVSGFEDTVFDAMDAMEGAELLPTTEVYNSIIYAFGKCGDADAAEFYFWEMRRKGLEQNTDTYNLMFAALAK